MTATDTPEQLDSRFRAAQELYDRAVRPQLTPADDGKYVALDIATGEYEIDASDYAASERLFLRHPDRRGWLFRVGRPTTYKMRRAAGP